METEHRAYAAEFFGTFLFTLFGGLQPHGPSSALANGVLLAVLVFATAEESGGHLNPAVSLGFYLTGSMELMKFLFYSLAQIVGAVIGSLFSSFLVGATFWSGVGPGCFVSSATTIQLFLWEFSVTFLLVAVVFLVAAHARASKTFGVIAPLVIGLTYYVGMSAADKYTGGSANPARTLGPAMIFGCTWGSSYVYIIGELLGGAAGAMLAHTVFVKPSEESGGFMQIPR